MNAASGLTTSRPRAGHSRLPSTIQPHNPKGALLSTTNDDAIRVVLGNLEYSGIDPGGSDGRWHLAMDVLAGLRPYILLSQGEPVAV